MSSASANPRKRPREDGEHADDRRRAAPPSTSTNITPAHPPKPPREEDGHNHDARRSLPPSSSHDSASRPRKRPGGAARVSRAALESVQQRQQERAAASTAAASQSRGTDEVVRQHYNAVPQRGREWRKTDSRIKGLRSFNNWVKSTIIHKFSPTPRGEDDADDSFTARFNAPREDPGMLKVLDIGCGKGGDLGKWAQAPQPVELYVGIDPAEVSIEQARERYQQMRPRHGGGGDRGRGGYRGGRPQRIFDAFFMAEDAFTYSLGDLNIIRQVGFGPGTRWGPSGGFDVVTMMFSMHYAFESEAKAKGMLANVSGSLKKGGRFFGVIPNSDVLSEKAVEFNRKRAQQVKEKESNGTSQAEHHPETARINGRATDGTNPSSSEEVKEKSAALNVITEPDTKGKKATNGAQEEAEEGEIGPGSLPSEEPDKKAEAEDSKVAEWGNSIYRVRFAGETPADGIFRPPFGWKYSYFMEEAVEEVPEYVVPWEAFRAIAEDYNLELQYRRTFREIWDEEGNSPTFGPLSERMGVRGRDGGDLLVSDEEMEAVSFYHAFCFYKI